MYRAVVIKCVSSHQWIFTTMQRLDQLIVTRGLISSRTRAQRLIKHGRVFLINANGQRLKALTRPGEKLADDVLLDIEPDEEERYVSRAGLKLEGLLDVTGLDVQGMTLLDIGQSTGGFTDCALQRGAARVIGIEVGHDQLDPSLRQDERVICMEGINARDLPHDAILAHAPEGIDGAMMDVSFISQTLILPSLAPLLPVGGHLLTLVKPQFELTRDAINDKGLVRNPALYADVEQRIRDCCHLLGLDVQCWHDSPIKGGDGNHEFILHAIKRA